MASGGSPQTIVDALAAFAHRGRWLHAGDRRTGERYCAAHGLPRRLVAGARGLRKRRANANRTIAIQSLLGRTRKRARRAITVDCALLARPGATLLVPPELAPAELVVPAELVAPAEALLPVVTADPPHAASQSAPNPSAPKFETMLCCMA